MDTEARLKAVESFLTSKFNYTVPVDPVVVIPPVSDYVEITNVSEIKKAGKYKLKAGKYSISQPYRLPNDVALDVTGSEFALNLDWTGVFQIDGNSNVSINGGTFNVGINTNIALVSNSKNVSLTNQTLAKDSGNGYRIIGGDGITLDGLQATYWQNYCVFADTGVKNLIIKNWNVDGGSKRESCVRGYVDNLTIKDCKLIVDKYTVAMGGMNKRVAFRLHEGTNYTITSVTASGMCGVGPMGGGDGGQQFGFTAFVSKDNPAWTVTDKNQADMAKTLEMRAKYLAFRTTKVRISNLNILEGGFQCNCGAVDVVWDGGSISNTAKADKEGWTAPNWCFYGYNNEYPNGKDDYQKRLPEDKPRPAPDITIHNLKLIGTLEDVKGYVKVGKGNTVNGKAI